MPLSIKERKQKWLDFMDVSSATRSIVLVTLSEEDTPARPWPYHENRKARLQWSYDLWQRQNERLSWLDDDTVPALSIYTGTEIFAEALGCQVYCSGDNMPFALPLLHNGAEVARLRPPELHASSLSELFEMGEQLRQRAGGDCVLTLPDIQSPVDIAALVWEKETFLMAMLDDPAAVQELVAITEHLLTAFLDEWFRNFGTGYIAHYPDYYMEGGFTFSEDEVGAFSPQMFDQFCLAPINRLSRRYGGCGMHCCANARHQWEGFKKIEGLRLLNLIQPMEILDAAAAFFGSSVCHWHDYGPGEKPAPSYPPHWVAACPPEAHVILSAEAHSRQEAVSLCGRLREIEAKRRQSGG